MFGLHSTSLELLADAHRQLDKRPGVNPVQSAAGTIREVADEDDNAPSSVGEAAVIAENADSEADSQRAADLLAEVLRGTDYDPNNPESYHPYNQ